MKPRPVPYRVFIMKYALFFSNFLPLMCKYCSQKLPVYVTHLDGETKIHTHINNSGKYKVVQI
jgi:hypothetical protein